MAAKSELDPVLAAALRKSARELAKRAGALGKNPDEKDIHDARVAANKLRLLLGLAEGGPGGGARRRMLGDLKRLKRALAPARDADVVLARLKGFGSPPSEAREGIQAIAREMTEACSRAGRELSAAVRARRFTRLVRDAKHLAETAAASAESPDSSAAKLADAFSARLAEEIAGRLARFEKRRAWLLEGFNGETLHRLRISGKPLRYLFGIFGAVRPETYGPLWKLLDEFHDCLGELHDLDVLERRVQTICWRTAEPTAEAAREWVQRRTLDRRLELMRQFKSIWLQLDSPEIRALWKAAKTPPKPAAGRKAPSSARGGPAQ